VIASIYTGTVGALTGYGVVRAFAPVLAANGGGAILNVLSAMSWLSYDGANAYSAAKAAEPHQRHQP
jgi:short-subunit dehydrogenase